MCSRNVIGDMMPRCPVCGSGETAEKGEGQWFCAECSKVTYVAPEAGIQFDFDIEDYLPEEGL